MRLPGEVAAPLSLTLAAVGYRPRLLPTSRVGALGDIELKARPRIVVQVTTEDGAALDDLDATAVVLSQAGSEVPVASAFDPWERETTRISIAPRDRPGERHVRAESIGPANHEAGAVHVFLPFIGDADLTLRLPGYRTEVLAFDAGDFVNGIAYGQALLREAPPVGEARVRLLDAAGAPLRKVRVFIQEDRDGVGIRTYLDTTADGEGYVDVSTLPEIEDRLRVSVFATETSKPIEAGMLRTLWQPRSSSTIRFAE